MARPKTIIGKGLETLRVWLLGGFRVSVGARTIEDEKWRLRKAAALVKILALTPGYRLHREQAIDLLWPHLGRAAAANNLRQVLHAARRILSPTDGFRYVASDAAWLVLCPGGDLWVDADAFEDAATTARSIREPAAYRAALDLYAGDLLPEDRYEAWAEVRREELRQLYLALLLGLAKLQEESDEHGQAIDALRKATAEEPTLEEAHAGLLRLYALSGRPEQALAQYDRFHDTLARRLGTEPAETTRHLRDEIAAGVFPRATSDEYPQGEAPASAGKHNLPAQRTSLIGREREVIEVKRALSMTRLLTLTGAGGSGKTRLALEVARGLVGAYPDGVWLVELAGLSEPEFVPQAVAGALGVPERPGQSPADTLIGVLRAKQSLLVLDNCEHLVEPAARLVDVLLDRCPRLRILATTREALRVQGELRWPVPTLSVPGPRGAFSAEELEDSESARLFAERARFRDPGFVLGSENATAVAEICRRLDGIPLAIELAAARVGSLSVGQILGRLEDSLGLLTEGRRGQPPRQRTLRGTLDWSHELLSSPEQVGFRRLSAFAGGFKLEAAEAVVPGWDIQANDVLDVLSGLVQKSLVEATHETEGGEVRYRMYEPVRQYAAEKLAEGGDGEEPRRRHAEYFLALAEEAEPELTGPEDRMWLDLLEAEHDNLRTALSWVRNWGETELNLRLASALGPFWEARGYYDEGRRRLEKALEKRGRASAAATARALKAVGSLALNQIDVARAEAAALEGLKLGGEAEIGGNLPASFLRILGVVAGVRGDNERAEKLLGESLALSRKADDKPEIVDALLNLGNNASLLGDDERAEELYEEGIAVCRDSGYARKLGDLLLSLGYQLLVEGEHERGGALIEEAAALFRQSGYRGHLEFVLDNLGWAALLQGDHERAGTFYRESLTLCKELSNAMTAAESLEGLACVFVAEGAHERAARLFGSAEALRGAVGLQHTPAEDALREPYLAAARSGLVEAMWEAAFAEGQAMGLDKAIAYALSVRGPTTSPDPVPDPSIVRPATLTRREEEIAALVARRMTNRQIAIELTLSRHTVANHVGKILRKLGVDSRSQITAWVVERRTMR